jgi:hypothetical protein
MRASLVSAFEACARWVNSFFWFSPSGKTFTLFGVHMFCLCGVISDHFSWDVVWSWIVLPQIWGFIVVFFAAIAGSRVEEWESHDSHPKACTCSECYVEYFWSKIFVVFFCGGLLPFLPYYVCLYLLMMLGVGLVGLALLVVDVFLEM